MMDSGHIWLTGLSLGAYIIPELHQPGMGWNNVIYPWEQKTVVRYVRPFIFQIEDKEKFVQG